MYSSLTGVLADFEKDAWEQLVKDFPCDLACLDETFRVLSSAVKFSCASQITLVKSIDETEEIDDRIKSAFAWTMLVSEARERLFSARLLLLTSHQSRCLSCLRDAFECLRWAHVCLGNAKQADRWLKGKKVISAPSQSYPPQPAQDISNDIQAVLSKVGTHPYMEACLIQTVVFPQQGADMGTKENLRRHDYEVLTRQTFLAFFSTLGQAIEYILDTNLFEEDKIPDCREVLEHI
jgi:hypothetical protein